MAQTKSLDDNIRLGDDAGKVFKIAGGIGVLFLLISFTLGYTAHDKYKQFLHSYLLAYIFVLSITLGMLWWVAVQHLVNAKWSIVIRRIGELFASNMLLMAVLAVPLLVPIVLGNGQLYEWANPAAVAADAALKAKSPYLNAGLFIARFVFYFGFWALLARYLFKRSLEQDKTGDRKLIGKMAVASGPGMFWFALTITFFAFDFIMSVEPHWFSTIFGVYYFAGCVMSVHATLALVLMWLQKKGRLVRSVNREHYHDLGKMMFAFVVFWAYIAFSQFMLYWYANIPEETHWYHQRFDGQWKWVSAVLLFGHFVIPFFGLLSRHVKRSKRLLAFWAIYLLVMQWIDLYWLVMPSMGTTKLPFNILDVTCLGGIALLCIAGAAYQARNVNLVPTKDHRLERSLAFENI